MPRRRGLLRNSVAASASSTSRAGRSANAAADQVDDHQAVDAGKAGRAAQPAETRLQLPGKILELDPGLDRNDELLDGNALDRSSGHDASLWRPGSPARYCARDSKSRHFGKEISAFATCKSARRL